MRWQKWLTNHTLISEAAASIIYVDLYEDSSLNEILNPYLCLFPFFLSDGDRVIQPVQETETI